MRYCLKMSSYEYGAEVFRYDSKEERQRGLTRLLKKVDELSDGVERQFTFYEEERVCIES